jgi:hypothetical protein
MRVILIGHPGSQHIVEASKYLTSKYLPNFLISYLNYTGEISGWSNFVADHLETLDDEKVIFALDDYFISGSNLEELEKAMNEGSCVKLCETTVQEHMEYPVTTQYTVWDRKLLISILRRTNSPWDFELNGGKYVGITSTVHTCIYYDVHTALSARWEGIHVNGLSYEDINYLINHKLL